MELDNTDVTIDKILELLDLESIAEFCAQGKTETSRDNYTQEDIKEMEEQPMANRDVIDRLKQKVKRLEKKAKTKPQKM